MKINNKGEIATILTVVTLGLMLVGTVVGTKLAEKSTEQRTEAKGFGNLTTQGLNGCQIIGTDQGPGCWCSEGGWQFHCFGGSDPNAKSGGTPSDLCESDCRKRNGMVKPPDGPGEQPGASCALAAQDPSAGNCCTTCIAGKRPDLRPFFNSNGWSACDDTRIVNNWCNGMSDVATNDCNAVKNGDCKAECSKDQSTCKATGGTAGGTAVSPAPTSPPSGAPGSPGGGQPKATVTPDPNGSYGKFVVIDKESVIRSLTPFPTSTVADSDGQTDFILKIGNGSSNLSFKETQNIALAAPAGRLVFDKTVSDNNETYYYYHLTYYPHEQIANRTAENQIKDAEIQIQVDEGELLFRLINQNLKLCNPYGKNFAEENLVPTLSPGNNQQELLINYCQNNNLMNTLNLDIDKSDPLPTPIPTPAIAYYVFKIRLKYNSPDTNNYTLIFNTTKNLSNFKTGRGGIVNIGNSDDKLTMNANSPTEITLSKDNNLGPFTNEYISDPLTPFVYQTNVLSDVSTPMMPVINSILIDNAVTNVTQAAYYYSEIDPCPITKSNPSHNEIIGACPAIEQALSLNSTTPVPTSATTPPGATGAAGPSPGESIPPPITPKTPVVVEKIEIQPPLNYGAIAISSISIGGISYLQSNYSSNIWQRLDADVSEINNANKLVTIKNKNINIDNDYFGSSIGVFNFHAFAKAEVTQDGRTFNVCIKSNLLDSITFKSTQSSGGNKLTITKDKWVWPSSSWGDCNNAEFAGLSGSSNEAFKNAMDKWVKGELNVLQMSAFISQLTRTPGLQITTCDPRKGECNPAF